MKIYNLSWLVFALLLFIPGCGKNRPFSGPEDGTSAHIQPASPSETREENQSSPATFFFLGQRGWLVVGGHQVLFTADTGETWNSLAVMDSVLHSIQMITLETGVALSDGDLLISQDGGRNWVSREFTGVRKVHQLQFFNEWHGIALVSDNEGRSDLAVTFDGGKLWDTQATECVGVITAMAFVDPKHGWYICAGKAIQQGGTAKALFRTSDGGTTWELLNETSPDGADEPGRIPVAGQVVNMFFLDEQHGWIGGARYGGMWATDNGGISWKQVDVPKGHLVTAIQFADLGTGRFILSQNTGSYLLETTDGGLSWSTLFPKGKNLED